MKQLDSVALELVNRSLGLAGAGSQTTELEDGLVQQVLEVSHLIGRGRAPITHAMKWNVLETVHATANNQVTAVDPYFSTSTPGSNPNWPVPIPAGFDIWYLGASGIQISGTLGIEDGYVGMVGDMQGDMGFSSNQAGAAATNAAIRYPLQIFNVATGIAGISFLCQKDGVPAMITPKGPIRLPRGSTLEFRVTSVAAATYQAYILCGVFPVGLGQDAVS